MRIGPYTKGLPKLITLMNKWLNATIKWNKKIESTHTG